jgi:hypothetical protein
LVIYKDSGIELDSNEFLKGIGEQSSPWKYGIFRAEIMPGKIGIFPFYL